MAICLTGSFGFDASLTLHVGSFVAQPQFTDRYQIIGRDWISHIFGRVCGQKGIEHRLTKRYHPWTNGEAERIVRTTKEATVRSFHYSSVQELRRHVRDWLTAYNFAKQLKALRFKTTYEAVEELWKSTPDIFNVKPHHHMMEPDT